MQQIPSEDLGNSAFLTGSDVPSHILDFVAAKTNNTLAVDIGKKHVRLTNRTINTLSRETPLGIVQTNKVIEVHNQKNTKYTFKVLDPNNTDSVINLVVVDMGDQIVEYFIQYIFAGGLAPQLTQDGVVDMAQFSGAMVFYDASGSVLGNYVLDGGDLVESSGTADPCPEDDDTGQQDGGDGSNDDDGSSGGGGDIDDNDPGDNDPTGGNGSDSGGSWIDGGVDWQPCELTVYYVPCPVQVAEGDTSHRPHDENECGEEVGSWYVYAWDCGGSWTNRNADGATSNSESPCGGDVGVIIDMESLKTSIEDCLGDAYDSSFFDDMDNLQYIRPINDYLNANGCSEEAMAFTVAAVEAIEEGTAVSMFPFVKYPDDLAEEYKNDYPNFTDYLKNELENLKNDQDIIAALDQIGIATQAQIEDALTWGSGPTVRITPLSADNTMLGKYNPTPLGEDGADYGPNVIEINSYFVDLLEETINSENPQYNIKALKFFIAVVIMHEFTHYADFNYTGYAFQQSGIETGNLFETNLFYDIIVDGQSFEVNIDNFNEVIQQYFLIRN